MKSSSRLLIGFGAAIGALVILALALVLMLPGQGEIKLPPADTPEGAVMRYLRAIEEGDLETAYGFLTKVVPDEKTWPGTFEEWSSTYYGGSRDNAWKATIIESDVYNTTARITVEISVFEPRTVFSNSSYSYKEIYQLKNIEDEWKIYEPKVIPWQIR